MGLKIEDYKEDEVGFRSETHFQSRITGEILEKNGRKTINEKPDDNPIIDGFALVRLSD